MASKIFLFKNYATPGLTTYATELDTLATTVESTINQIIDELRGVNASNSVIAQDILLPAGASAGRMDPSQASISFTIGQTQITVGSGIVYFAGQRVSITGAVLTGFSSATTRFIAASLDGILSVETAPLQQAFDIATIVQAGATLQAGEVTDNLAAQRLNGSGQVNRLARYTDPDGVNLGLLDPSIRMVDETGTLEDAGLASSLTPNRFLWQSQRDGGAGVGNAVTAGEFREVGQLHLMEQARVFAERTTNQSVPNTGFTAITFDTPVANSSGGADWRREPEEYVANPFIAAAGASLTLPSGADYDGTYLWTATIILAFVDETWVDARIIQTVGGSKVIDRVRVASAGATETVLSLSGFVDLVNADAVQLQIDHNGTGNQNVTFARLCGMLVGGPV